MAAAADRTHAAAAAAQSDTYDADSVSVGRAVPASSLNRLSSTGADIGGTFGCSMSSNNARQRSASEPPAAAAAVTAGAAARITSSQLRDIGQMLARLTRENAALIKQRDGFKSELAPAKAQAAQAAAAAEAAARDRDVLVEARRQAGAEAEAAAAAAASAAASVKQLSAERDRLLHQVGAGVHCHPSVEL